MNPYNILILDDERRVCEELSEYLVRKKFQVYAAEKPSSAFRIMEHNHIDILFLDFTLPEMDGILVLKKVKKQFPEIKVIMISGNGNISVVKEAKRNGAAEFINKPFLHNEVQNAIECLNL